MFRWLAETGGIAPEEMLKTFNCGIGMIVVVDSDRAEAVSETLANAGETVTRIGTVTAGEGVQYSGSLL